MQSGCYNEGLHNCQWRAQKPLLAPRPRHGYHGTEDARALRPRSALTDSYSANDVMLGGWPEARRLAAATSIQDIYLKAWYNFDQEPRSTTFHTTRPPCTRQIPQSHLSAELLSNQVLQTSANHQILSSN